MPSRERIFARIRHNLGRGPLDEMAANTLKARIEGHAPHTIPKRTDIPHKQQVDLFQAKAEALAATVARIPSMAEVPEALRDYLAAHNLSTRIKMAPDARFDDLPFDKTPMLEIMRGAAAPAMAVTTSSGSLRTCTPSSATSFFRERACLVVYSVQTGL